MNLCHFAPISLRFAAGGFFEPELVLFPAESAKKNVPDGGRHVRRGASFHGVLVNAKGCGAE